MKIIIDAMGGDNAPLEIVKGALLGMECSKPLYAITFSPRGII